MEHHRPARKLDSSLGRRLALCLLGLALLPATDAQRFEESPFEEYLQPNPGDTPQNTPRLVFELVADLALPGPLPGVGPRLNGERIEIPVAGGLASTSWDGQAQLRIDARPEPPLPTAEIERSEYGVAPDGRFRAAALRSGWIVAEKRCRHCARGWSREWKLRVPGSEFARPLVTDRRVFFGATDNRVYCVKRRNGHRVWDADVEGRVSRPLELLSLAPWDPSAEAPEEVTLVLVVPDSGPSVLALDARSGTTLAAYELPENEAVVGAPLGTPDGRVAVARQRYNTREASLMLFDLSRAEPNAGRPAADVAHVTAAEGD